MSAAGLQQRFLAASAYPSFTHLCRKGHFLQTSTECFRSPSDPVKHVAYRSKMESLRSSASPQVPRSGCPIDPTTHENCVLSTSASSCHATTSFLVWNALRMLMVARFEAFALTRHPDAHEPEILNTLLSSTSFMDRTHL